MKFRAFLQFFLMVAGVFNSIQNASPYTINPNNLIDESLQVNNEKIDKKLWEHAQKNNLNYYNFVEKTCYHHFWVTRCLDVYRLLMKNNAKIIKQQELNYQQQLQEYQRKSRYYQVNELGSNKDNVLPDYLIAVQNKQALLASVSAKQLQEKQSQYLEKQVNYNTRAELIKSKKQVQPLIKSLLRPLPTFKK